MFKPLRIIVVTAALLTGTAALACLNSYKRKELPLAEKNLQLNLLLNIVDNQLPYWYNGWGEDDLIQWEHLSTLKIDTLNFRDQSDFAVLQLKFGKKKEGLELLQSLYRLHPTEYNIVANLGTAYELNGDKSKALELLKKAMAINPLSHYGSEWIHIRILEEELAAKPDYRNIINLKTGNFQSWLLDKTYRFPLPADSLKMQIAFQLHERTGLIAPPNKAIGQLVTDFADIVAKTDSLGAAKEFYEFALSYDSTLRDTIAARIKGVESSQKEVKNTFRWATIVWAIPLLALVLIFFAWLRSIRNQKGTEQ